MTAAEWQTGLAMQGAVIENGAVMHFGNPDAELIATAKANVLCDLTHLGLLEINGPDAVTFLQGQVTNDVKLLAGNNAHYTAYCTPKGRMLALFLAFAHHDHLHLQLNRELLEPIMKRLKMYVMRSKVDIKDASEDIIKFGLNGLEAASMLVPVFTKIPTQDYELVSLENGAILKLPTTGNNSRFEILTDSVNAPAIWNALKVDCQPVGKPCWDWLEIQAGIPDITPATQEQFVPQMLNLDLLNAISFKKGCYTGQEIVARTHYLGSVKRRTYLASIESAHAPLAGDKVMDGAKNEVGQIVRVAVNPSGSFDALIEMRIDAKEAGNIYWNDSVVTSKSLPYALES
ncbi:MAG TPA: folate-binding protein [Methylotenera sp.]|nr:folate-binding protein [Methylotenera sp.]HPV43960.1 folate-binding protein [Methylotenera sp.]